LIRSDNTGVELKINRQGIVEMYRFTAFGTHETPPELRALAGSHRLGAGYNNSMVAPGRPVYRLLPVAIALSMIVAASPAHGDVSDLQTTLPETGGTIDLLTPQPLPVPHEQVEQWVERAAAALTHFYGRYPVKYVAIHVLPGGRGDVNGGVEHIGRRIDIRLGSNTTQARLLDDWMITHEMFHLSQPNTREGYSWMSEGMADYLEPVARVRIGQITPERFWGDLVEGMPQGLPQAGDQGLDHTRTWGRTYWGGSLFWLLADIRVRQQTDNKKSVRDAARAVLDAGGNGSQTWPLNRMLDDYDRATGTTVFKDLHDEMGAKPVQTDLDALWKSLGVVYDKGKVTFDDGAPLAKVRRGITAREE
jgi:hypothetical protein